MKKLKGFSFFNHSTQKDISFINESFQNIDNQQVIVIDQITIANKQNKNLFLLIVFKKTVILVEQSLLFTLESLFLSKPNLNFLFLSRIKDIFDNNIKIQYNNFEMSEILKTEYSNFIENSFGYPKERSLKTISVVLYKCLSIFLITQGYHKLNQNRIKNYISDENDRSYIEKQNIARLRNIEAGYSTSIVLYYNIEKEELCVTKEFQPNFAYDSEAIEANKREITNYSKMPHHPFIPKYYGTIEKDTIVIEFINGQTLHQPGFIQSLTENDRITIIFELLIVFEFLHRNHFIYRDLKPNNIIIDENKTLVLIDFDRMLEYDNFPNISKFTADFNPKFIAPEVITGNFSYECDIYSIGLMMEWIINGENNFNGSPDFGKHFIIKKMYEKCTKKEPKERPTIYELIHDFYLHYKSQIEINKDDLKRFFDVNSIALKIEKDETDMLIKLGKSFFYNYHDYDQAIYYYSLAAVKNNVEAQHFLGLFYYENDDIKKAIFYFSQAAKQNHTEALYYLGYIYQKGENGTIDINKAIDYYSLAASQNHSKSLFNLALIYLDDEYKEYKKAIHYFTLAADLNNYEAQFHLGRFYYNGIGVERDAMKGIDWFQKAANNNYSEAQYYLGRIFNQSQYIRHDINKTVYYFTLAANNNHTDAQYELAELYFQGKLIKRDINKAMHYYELAANQNHLHALFRIGLIYYEGLNANKNISKAIHYFELASNQNHPVAQFYLGTIYIEGIYVERDINKAIYYLELAAKQNLYSAQFNLGTIYYDGKFVKQDINKVIDYLELAANQNFDEAQYQLGLIYYDGRFIQPDYNKSIYYFQLAANQNYAAAQFNLGEIYLNNQRDIEKALYYLNCAANNNHLQAQKNLASYYLKGDIVSFNIQNALYYLSLAAKQNDAIAQYNLGCIYFDNKYIKSDISKSIEYLTLAASQNHLKAQLFLGDIYCVDDYVKSNINEAMSYYKSASKQGSSKATYNLGIIYLKGTKITRDINKSMLYLDLASRQNLPHAQYSLGVLYYSGIYVKKDIPKALKYFKLAAENNFALANFYLGLIYLDEKYMPRDLNKSVSYLSKAADQNIALAEFYLGLAYYISKPDNPDTDKIISLFFSASKQNHADALYFLGLFYIEKDQDKGIHYLKEAAENGNIEANFALGFLYHTMNNIEEAQKYYKEASSFNNQYAKNNIGIIYKNSFETDFAKNIQYAFLYFDENKNDKVSMYNLAHMYFFGEINKVEIDKSIKLLIKSYENGFIQSIELLCLALIKKVGFDANRIRKEIDNNSKKSNIIMNNISKTIKDEHLYDPNCFEIQYQKLKKTDYLYNHLINVLPLSEINNYKINQLLNELNKPKNLTKAFYDGFGIKL